jgi:hypothetical protein
MSRKIRLELTDRTIITATSPAHLNSATYARAESGAGTESGARGHLWLLVSSTRTPTGATGHRRASPVYAVGTTPQARAQWRDEASRSRPNLTPLRVCALNKLTAWGHRHPCWVVERPKCRRQVERFGPLRRICGSSTERKICPPD